MHRISRNHLIVPPLAGAGSLFTSSHATARAPAGAPDVEAFFTPFCADRARCDPGAATFLRCFAEDDPAHDRLDRSLSAVRRPSNR